MYMYKIHQELTPWTFVGKKFIDLLLPLDRKRVERSYKTTRLQIPTPTRGAAGKFRPPPAVGEGAATRVLPTRRGSLPLLLAVGVLPSFLGSQRLHWELQVTFVWKK